MRRLEEEKFMVSVPIYDGKGDVKDIHYMNVDEVLTHLMNAVQMNYIPGIRSCIDYETAKSRSDNDL